jgi:Zn-dependent M28 family amino/carboxypeptidase
MSRSQALIFCLAASCAVPAFARPFSGEKALAFTREAVADGPRPSGSPAIEHLRVQILAELKRTGCKVSFDDFTATTPDGAVKMRNIICTFPGKSGRAIVITGHYDTKKQPGFVGANDGGSSTGFLMELAAASAGAPRTDDLVIVFFDGEEAVKQWQDGDNTYGSRHLAETWKNDGMLGKIKALINVDMIGDKDLDLIYDTNSTTDLRNLVWTVAEKSGYGAHFPRTPSAMEDDHIPFIQAGVKSLDLIDFTFGPRNQYWHTTQDTMDKLSANSFAIIGAVVMDSIRELEAQP